MKRLLSLLLAFACMAAWGDGAALLQSGGYAAKAQESALTHEESKTLAEMRATTPYLDRYLVSLNLAALNTNVITLAAPDGTQMQYIGNRTTNADGSMTWVGDSKDGQHASFSSGPKGEGFAGTFQIGDSTFEVSGLNARFQVMHQVKPKPGLNTGPDKPIIRTPAAAPAVIESGRARALANVRPLAIGDPTINILTVYTPTARAAKGGTTNMIAAINAEIGNLNASFTNSGVHLNAASVGTYETNNIWTSATEAINGLLLDLSIANIRDAYHADVVIAIINGAVGSDEGVAIQYNGTPTEPYAAVDVSVLSNFTYEHEFGHLLGACHDIATPCGAPFAAGSHGWLVRDHEPFFSDYCFHTLMSYPNSVPCLRADFTPALDPRILYWSNAGVHYPPGGGGYSTGSAQAANFITLNLTGPQVATYRNHPLSPSLLVKYLSAVLTDD